MPSIITDSTENNQVIMNSTLSFVWKIFYIFDVMQSFSYTSAAVFVKRFTLLRIWRVLKESPQPPRRSSWILQWHIESCSDCLLHDGGGLLLTKIRGRWLSIRRKWGHQSHVGGGSQSLQKCRNAIMQLSSRARSVLRNWLRLWFITCLG